MTKVSASTLARRAAKTKNPKEAKRLRAMAAKLRRDARKPRPAEKIVKGLNQALEMARAGINQDLYGDKARAASPDSWSLTPGHGEIVGGKLARKADEITKLARGKHGADAVQKELSELERRAQSNGFLDGVTAEHKAWRNALVSSFVAAADAMEKANGGRLPPVVSVPGLTLSCLLSALSDAGFTEHGAYVPSGL